MPNLKPQEIWKSYIINTSTTNVPRTVATVANLKVIMVKKMDILEMPVSKDCIVYQAKEADVAILTIGRQAGEGNDRTIENRF